MNKSKSAIAALALTVGLAVPCPAQQAPIPPQTTASEACAEYFGCLHYGTLTEAQARTTRGHPQFVKPTAGALHAMELSATPDRTEQTSRTVASSRR